MIYLHNIGSKFLICIKTIVTNISYFIFLITIKLVLRLLKLFMYKKIHIISSKHVNEFEIKLMKRKSKIT